MEINTIVTVVTFLATFLLGQLSKKFNFVKTNLIPLQNLTIGLFVGLISYFAGLYDNLLNALVISLASSLSAGGAYDLVQKKKKE